MSYVVVNLYPPVPVEKAINVLIDTLNSDKEQLKECTKWTLTNAHKLTELSLSKCHFLYQNKNSGPIGLSGSNIRMLFAE